MSAITPPEKLTAEASRNAPILAEAQQTVHRPFANPDGTFNIERIGLEERFWTDAFHYMLIMRWRHLLGLILVTFLLANTVFAALYLLQPGSLENTRPGSFADAFAFSVQTMATIGYGKFVPATAYANALVTLEALFGLLGVAMATGVMFSRISRPTARVLFSDVAVIYQRDGIQTLAFRMANARRNVVVEAQIRVVLARDEVTLEGESIRKLYDINLTRSVTPMFALGWLATHRIDTTSPLYGETRESLMERTTTLLVTFTGYDDSFNQTVHARHLYRPDQIHFGMRLVDVFRVLPDGRRLTDYRNFHLIEPENAPRKRT